MANRICTKTPSRIVPQQYVIQTMKKFKACQTGSHGGIASGAYVLCSACPDHPDECSMVDIKNLNDCDGILGQSGSVFETTHDGYRMITPLRKTI